MKKEIVENIKGTTMPDNKTNYAQYDYSVALNLYKTSYQFQVLTDQIEDIMTKTGMDPQEVREACQLAILKSVQKQLMQGIKNNE